MRFSRSSNILLEIKVKQLENLLLQILKCKAFLNSPTTLFKMKKHENLYLFLQKTTSRD